MIHRETKMSPTKTDDPIYGCLFLLVGGIGMIGAPVFFFCARYVSDDMPHGPAPIYGMSVLFGIMGLSGLLPSLHPMIVRLLSAAVAVTFGLFTTQFIGTPRLQPALLTFLVVLAALGYMTITGRYPWNAILDLLVPVNTPPTDRSDASDHVANQKAVVRVTEEPAMLGEEIESFAKGPVRTMAADYMQTDLTRLSPSGCLLFLISIAFVIGGCFVLGFSGIVKPDGDPAQQMKPYVLVIMLVGIAIFQLGRIALKLVGAPVYREKSSSEQNRDDFNPPA